MPCILIRDRFGDVYADKTYDACTARKIRETAGYLAHSVATVDEGETVSVGVCAIDDPGLARLRATVPYAEGGVEWLYEIDANELPGYEPQEEN